MSHHTQVILGEVDCGVLWGDRQRSTFLFEADYLTMPARPVLGQWFEDRLSARARRSRGLLPWFENLLPERGGELRRRLCRELSLDEDDDFQVLRAVGDQLPGHVRVEEAPGAPTVGPTVGVAVDEDSEPVSGMRVSLGGMQFKMALSGAPDRLAVGVALADEAEWILKIPSLGLLGLPDNEAAIMRWCASAFEVPEVRVVTAADLPDAAAKVLGDKLGFLVRRYDRTPKGRLHQEDFAQVLNIRPGAKYDGAGMVQMAQAVAAILGEPGLHEFIRRAVAVVATGNSDAHLKNWSLLYPDGARPQWSPLYDQVATVAFQGVDHALALRMGTAKHFREVSRSNLVWLGGRVGVEEAVVHRLVEETLDTLRTAFVPDALGMTPELADSLRAHWRQVPLLRRTPLA